MGVNLCDDTLTSYCVNPLHDMATSTSLDTSPTALATPIQITTGEQTSTSTPDYATVTGDDTWTGIGPTDTAAGDVGQNAIKFILPVIGVLIGVFFLICIVSAPPCIPLILGHLCLTLVRPA